MSRYVTIYSTSEGRLLHRLKCILISCYVVRRYNIFKKTVAQQQQILPPAPPPAGRRQRLRSLPPSAFARTMAEPRLPRSRPPAAVAIRICGADDRATGLSKADATDDRLAQGDQEKRHQRQRSLTFFTPMMLPTPPRDGSLNKITTR